MRRNSQRWMTLARGRGANSRKLPPTRPPLPGFGERPFPASSKGWELVGFEGRGCSPYEKGEYQPIVVVRKPLAGVVAGDLVGRDFADASGRAKGQTLFQKL